MPSLSVPFMASHVSSLSTATAASFSLFYTTLLSSIFLYRISPLHPLAKHSGPFLAKVSKLWNVWVMVTEKNHLRYKALHAQYGPYVRIGMCILSIQYRFYKSESALAIKCIHVIINTLHHIGPNELSVTDVAAISSISLAQTECRKALVRFFLLHQKQTD